MNDANPTPAPDAEPVYTLGIMTPEEIARLPIRKYNGPVLLVESEKDLARALQALRAEKVAGLDTETKPTFRKGQYYPPSLVQIAAASGVFLFPMKWTGCFGALTEILENPRLVKAGVGLSDDFKNLQKIFPFAQQNTVDLGLVARSWGYKRSGVRSLSAELLGFRITKGAATSNWANPRLTPKQIDYAATDAWACRELFLHFQKLGYLDPEGRPIPSPRQENPPMPKNDNAVPSADMPLTPAKIADWAQYQKGSVVSRKIVQKPAGNITFFAFDQGEALSEHVSPFDALVCVLDGEARFTVSGRPHAVKAGEMLLMPANQPHALDAVTPFKMLLVMVKA